MQRSASGLRALLETTLHVRPGEERRTALLFTHLLLAAAVFILGRTVRDTLFLSRYSLAALPWMFVLYGLASAVTAGVYGRVADRLPRDRSIVWSCGIGIVTYLGVWVLVRAEATWVYPVFYVWSEVVANLLIVQFWTLANDLHDARAAKRLFGTIGAARVLGGMLVGLGAGAVVTALGTAQLLFVLAGLMGAIAVLARILGREPRPEVPRGTVRRRGSGRGLLADSYVRTLSLVTLLAFIALTVGDYQFKVIARAAFREDQLARFFALFYAGTGLLSFLFQLFATPRLLARLGVGAGMATMPTVFGLSNAALLLGPRLAVATVAKFADNGFQYSIHETTLQALYVPFPAETKARTRAFLDAVVKPLSYGAGGLALVALAPRLPVHLLSFVNVPLVLGWLVLIPLARRLYLARLEASLSARLALGFEDEPLVDEAGRRRLLRVLESDDGPQILLALEGLTGLPALKPHLLRLLDHQDPRVREAALRQIAEAPEPDLEALARGLSDPETGVRIASATLVGSLAGDDALDRLRPLLDDPKPKVRAAALGSLLRHGGVEGALLGAPRLEALLGSPEKAARTEAAEALGLVGREAYRPLARLLRDPSGAVRRAALGAAEQVADPRLVPVLVEALGHRGARRRAARALAAVGSPAIGPLLDALSDPATPRDVRLLLPRVLRRIAVPESYEKLRACLSSEDSHLRLRVFAALARLRRVLGRRPEPLGFVMGLVRGELMEVLGNLAAWERARADYGSPLLEEVFAFRQERAVRRVLRVLELRYASDSLRLVREYLGDPRRRPNALEVLDTLLDPPLRPLVMPFLDDLPAEERVRRAGSLVPAPPPPAEFMARQCLHPNPYVALLALDAVARHGDAGVEGLARAALRSPEPLVREGAVRALRLGGLSASEALASLLADPDPMVRRQAEAASRPEEPMYGTLEKVLVLRKAAIFDRLSGEDLAPLARVAEVECHGTGDPIFSEGEVGDSLYVIVRGRVGIQREGETLASLGPGEAFGEMAVLDASARSATALALEDTELLQIGSEEFYEVLHEQAEIAEGVIRVLTRRLRETDETLARLRNTGVPVG